MHNDVVGGGGGRNPPFPTALYEILMLFPSCSCIHSNCVVIVTVSICACRFWWNKLILHLHWHSCSGPARHSIENCAEQPCWALSTLWEHNCAKSNCDPHYQAETFLKRITWAFVVTVIMSSNHSGGTCALLCRAQAICLLLALCRARITGGNSRHNGDLHC